MTGGTGTNPWLRAAVLLALAVSNALGQPSLPNPPLAEPALAEAQAEARTLEETLPQPQAVIRPTFDLSPDRQERLRKYLPKTLLKLTQREPVHILAAGDASLFSAVAGPGDPPPPSFAAVFAKALADRFFYTGGVSPVGSGGQNFFGPTIALHEASASGILSAAGLIATEAARMPVDLVLICHGHADAANGMPPPRFARAVEDAVKAARMTGADVVLCGPWLPMAPSTEVAWGRLRPLTSAMAAVAQQESIIMADLGDLAGWLTLPELGEVDSPRVFDAIDRACRSLFLEQPAGVFVPRASLHARLGRTLYEQIVHGRSAAIWKVSKISAEQRKPDQLILRFEVENPGKKPLMLSLFPLVASGWRPVGVTARLDLPPGGKRQVAVEYSQQNSAAFSLEEPVSRLPVLSSANGEVRIDDLTAPVRPLALVWQPATLFNQEEAFLANCQIVNNGNQDVTGGWSAQLGGARLEGKFTAKGQGGTAPLDLRFDLPGSALSYRSLPLTVTVTAGNLRLEDQRQVEVAPNLGLGTAAPLRGLRNRAEAANSGVTMTASADPAKLVLQCEVSDSAWMQPGADGGPAWQLDVNIDARSYGKRLEHGATATLRITGSATDGPARVHEVAPWAFGNGYAATFEPSEFGATLSTTNDGRRHITLAVPKSYLYLHEWALGNGNSQIGLNVRLTLRQTPLGGAEKIETYALSANTKAPEDVESLVVLELTDKPTKRLTVNLY